MKKLLSTKYSAGTMNMALLVLRAGMAGLMMHHGFDKLTHFNEYSAHFINFMGIGSKLSLALVIFSEFFCSLFLLIGLFSRLVTIPLLFGLLVALFKAHKGDVFGDGEHAGLFIVGFFVLLLTGPGKISVDGMMGK